MKIYSLISMPLLYFASFSAISDDCEYFINHQSNSFVKLIESVSSSMVQIEYYFSEGENAYKFRKECKLDGGVEDGEQYSKGKIVYLLHNIQFPRFALAAWFATHYEVVCCHGGVINDWEFQTVKSP